MSYGFNILIAGVLRIIFFGASLLSVLAGSPARAGADQRLPIIDMHVHYNAPAWRVFDPAYVKEILDRAKVTRILVSSWPDNGTLKLYKAYPEIVLPAFMPYNKRVMPGNWTKFPGDVLPDMQDRLAKTAYVGIGEIHIYDVRKVDWVVLEKVVRAAREHNIFLHVHCKDDAIRRLYSIDRDVSILWAHAGLSVAAETVDRTMREFPGLMTELSLRAINIIPEEEGADIWPEWRKLLMTHQDRLVLGTDTYMNLSWAEYDELIAAHRRWLNKLPRPVAEKISYRNAERFLGR